MRWNISNVENSFNQNFKLFKCSSLLSLRILSLSKKYKILYSCHLLTPFSPYKENQNVYTLGKDKTLKTHERNTINHGMYQNYF